jgi:hypothetical protein
MTEAKPNKPDKPIPDEPAWPVSQKLEFIADSIEDMFILAEKDAEANDEPRKSEEEELRDSGRYFQHQLMRILGERELWSALEQLEWHKPVVAVDIQQRIKEVNKWSSMIAPNLDFPRLFATVECLTMGCKGLVLTLRNVAKMASWASHGDGKVVDELVKLKDIIRHLWDVQSSMIKFSESEMENYDPGEKDSEDSEICYEGFVRVLGELHGVQALVLASQSQLILDCDLPDSLRRLIEDMERCLSMAQDHRMQYRVL